MNVTHAAGDRPAPARPRRVARFVASSMALATGALLAHAAVTDARFELVATAVGLGLGAALVGLLALGPSGLSVVSADRR